MCNGFVNENTERTKIKLDYNLYEKLNSKKRKGISKDSWFDESIIIFQNQRLESKDDLIKLIAFAYSWMPTIPSFNKEDIDFECILENLKKLKKNEDFDIQALPKNLIPLTNYSIVGASKVLFFVNPITIPIIDSRLISCWNEQIANKENNFKIRNIDSDNCDKKIEPYLGYWKNLKHWQENCLTENKIISMRDLEIVLYNYNSVV